MPTANERRALWFLTAVALSGSVVRLARSRVPDAPPDPALQRQIVRVDSARAGRDRRDRRDRREPPTGGNLVQRPAASTPNPVTLELNHASAAELERLPGIGPTLAARIIAVRDSLHGFRDVGGLCGVRGVGTAMVQRLRPLVTLSGERLGDDARCIQASRAAPKSRPARRSKPR